MEIRIRKLNEDDVTALGDIIDCNETNKIIIEEILKEKDYMYKPYGLFIDEVLVGYCSLSSSDEYSSYKDWTNDCASIGELFIKEEYSTVDLYCDILYYILFLDEENKNLKIYYDNNINLENKYFSHLGFIELNEGLLVRIPDSLLKEESN